MQHLAAKMIQIRLGIARRVCKPQTLYNDMKMQKVNSESMIEVLTGKMYKATRIHADLTRGQ